MIYESNYAAGYKQALADAAQELRYLAKHQNFEEADGVAYASGFNKACEIAADLIHAQNKCSRAAPGKRSPPELA